MAKRLLMPLLAAIIIAAMVIPGCGDPAVGPFELTTEVNPEGAGTVSFTGTSPFDPNVEIPVEATAGAGFEFDRWTATAGFFGDEFSASTTFTMPTQDATITASFREVRTEGFWLDYVTIEKEPDEVRGVERLVAGDIDVLGAALSSTALFDIVEEDPNLWYKSSIGTFNTMRLNPYGPLFDDGSLNPLHYPEMQAALNKYIDRTFIAMDIEGGLAWERFTAFHPQLPDYFRFVDDTYVPLESSIQYLEDKYDYDEAEGWTWVEAAIDAINADLAPDEVTWDDDLERWIWDGDVIEMTIAIRSDDPIREEIGDYLVVQLQKMGFEASGFKGDMAATLSGLANVEAEITGGGWSIYTGGWISTVLLRDEAYWFCYFHTSLWAAGIPAFAYLEVPDELWDAAWDLLIMNFSTIEGPGGRDELVGTCLPLHMEYGMMYLTAARGFSPLSTSVDMAADGAGGIHGSWMWALTAHFRESSPVFGGHLRIAMHDLLVEPWNPIAGSNTVYDMMPIRATGDMGTHPDTRDGLRWAGRIDRADVTVTTGLPVLSFHDWVDLSFADEIEAPADAWRDWDPVTQTPRTVADALDNPEEPWGLADAEVSRYSVAYYPEDIWDHPLHDGSTLSFADFLYGWFMGYERGQEESAIYDPAAESMLASTRDSTIGVRFTVNPEAGVGLKVEVWSTVWQMDAERMIGTGFPNYAQGNGFWHPIALGIRGERAGDMAFGEVKGQPLPLGWINFLNRDVQLGALVGYLDDIIDEATYSDAIVPFYDFINAQYAAAGLGSFAPEVDVRMENLKDFVGEVNHLWVGSGPYYVDDYSFALNWIRLAAFEAYPDDPERWFFLLEDLD